MFISLVPSTTSNKKAGGLAIASGYLIMQKGVLITLLTLLNPLNTNDACTRHATLAARYQLAQSILKDRFCASKQGGVGEVGGHSHNMPCTIWQLSWQAEKVLVGTGWAVSLFFF